ncbi:hypothetical protein [Nocardia sp. NBC_01327]|uniref:hypothetical protein n=1 Tax=Nocardia sp. NBC_01327 TaxID=2903593 RepID=UPI002E1165C7|nr:hypothetical protein OG326_08210 [Nocardia sp. NBC_01327]
MRSPLKSAIVTATVAAALVGGSALASAEIPLTTPESVSAPTVVAGTGSSTGSMNVMGGLSHWMANTGSSGLDAIFNYNLIPLLTGSGILPPPPVLGPCGLDGC